MEKDNLKCDHCNMNGHAIATCFRIHGYPDWYRNLKTQQSLLLRQANSVHSAGDTPLDFTKCDEAPQDSKTIRNMYRSDIIHQEIAKYLKDKDPFSHVNVAQADFAGLPSHLSLNSSTTEIIIGTRCLDY